MTPRSRVAWIPGLLLVAGLCLLIFGYRLGSTGFWTDESIYAQTAREMAGSGDWITPRLCGKPYLIKPILYHWLAAVAFHLLGETELAGRLPQAAAGFLGVMGVTLFAWRVFGRGTGVLAGAVLATCPGYAIGSRVAGMDILLTVGIALSLGSFLLGYRERHRRRAWFVACGFWTGMAVLAKGPLGVGLPAMVIIVFLLRRREFSIILSRPALEGAATALVVASVWYLPVWLRHGTRFSHVFWVKNNLARLVDPVSDHAGPVTYYLPVFLLAFLPWSFPFGVVLIRSAVRFLRRAGASGDPAIEFLWISFLVPFAAYSLITTKLPAYLLPVFPAAAILTAREWQRYRPGEKARPDWGFRAAGALGVASLPGVALAVPFLLQYRYGLPRGYHWLFPLVTFVFAAVALGSALRRKGRLRSAWWVAATAAFTVGFVRFAIAPAAPYESMREMTALLLVRQEGGYPVALAGPHLKGTYFYTDCTVPMPRDLNDLPRPGPGQPLFCLVKDRFRPDLEAWAERGRFTVRTVASRGTLSLVEVSP